MKAHAINIILLISLIFIIRRSKLIGSIKENYFSLINLIKIIINKKMDDQKKEKLFSNVCLEILKQSTYQILIFFLIFSTYLIFFMLYPKVKIIFFSFYGLIEGLVVSIIFLKFIKNE